MHITCETCAYFTYNANWLITDLITLIIKKLKQIPTLFP